MSIRHYVHGAYEGITGTTLLITFGYLSKISCIVDSEKLIIPTIYSSCYSGAKTKVTRSPVGNHLTI